MTNPKDFNYVLPEDYVIKPEHRERLDAIMTEMNATEEQAQKIIDLHVDIVEDTLAQVMAADSGPVKSTEYAPETKGE